MITGVSRGLGESLAFVLLQRGWQVVGLGRASAARLHGARYRFVEIDLADVSAIDATMLLSDPPPANDSRRLNGTPTRSQVGWYR